MIDADQVLRMFSEDKQKARKLYNAYMNDGLIVKKRIYTAQLDKGFLEVMNFLREL